MIEQVVARLAAVVFVLSGVVVGQQPAPTDGGRSVPAEVVASQPLQTQRHDANGDQQLAAPADPAPKQDTPTPEQTPAPTPTPEPVVTVSPQPLTPTPTPAPKTEVTPEPVPTPAPQPSPEPVQQPTPPPTQAPPQQPEPQPSAGATTGPAAEQIAHDARWPNESTTGVPDGVALTPAYNLTVTEDGTVLDALDIRGTLEIKADDVVVRNSRVRPYDGNLFGIRIHGGFTGTLIEDTEVIGGAECLVAIAYANYTARRVDVSNCRDGMKAGSNTRIEHSYIHDLAWVPGAHCDGIQSSGSLNVRIVGNRIAGRWRTSTSAMKFTAESGDVRNVVIRDNYLSGGAFTLYLTVRDGYVADNLRIFDNVWMEGSWAHAGVRRDSDVTNVVWTGNVTNEGAEMT